MSHLYLQHGVVVVVGESGDIHVPTTFNSMEKTMSKINLELDLVRSSNGKYDLDAMTVAARNALVRLEAERETEEATIADAVNAIFDEFKGAAINMPALLSMTTQRLNAQPSNFKVLSERASAYVHENSQGDTDKATGAVQRPNSLFVIGKGKGGGVRRRADIVAKPETETEAK